MTNHGYMKHGQMWKLWKQQLSKDGTFLLKFQLVDMEANIITLLFKEKIVAKKIVEANVDVDLTLPMSKVVEIFF